VITQRAQLFLSFIDDSDSIGNMSFWLADGVDLATAESEAATIRPLLEACSGAVVIRQSVVFSAVESPRPEASAGADSSRVGGLIFSCDTGELDITEIHGLKDELLITTGPGADLLIDRTNSAIIDLVDELISGPWCNPFAYDMLALEAAFLQIRR
jgi:hypothetical protein